MKTFGLIGRNISYSFSKAYFSQKFKAENIEAEYLNFDLQSIDQIHNILKETPQLSGLNVTIPYKEEIIPFLSKLDSVAKEILAVNTIKIETDGSLTGYNTDYFGFQESLKPHLQAYHKKALILGTGGASKAIAYALRNLKISYTFVSRNPEKDQLSYTQLSKEVINENHLIINCTPLGTYPNIENFPPIPVEFLSPKHLIYDLIYNPEITQLMKLALNANAKVINGKKMLQLQAEKAWEIWNR